MLRPARHKLEEEDFIPQQQQQQQQQESPHQRWNNSKRCKMSKALFLLTLVTSVLLLGILVAAVHLATTSTVSLDLTTIVVPASSGIDIKEEGAVVPDDAKSDNTNHYTTSNVTATTGSDNEDKNEDKQQQISVFYNVFINSLNDVPTVQKIVEEQLSNLRPYHKVFVRSIGVPLQIEKNTNTTLLQYDEKGWEPETLRLLWQHCQIHPHDKVVYIHSKGSFTPNNDNELLRRFITRGALSEECSNLPSSCNVCSSRMSPVPHPHTSGNMWLARCDYVQNLIDPELFEGAMNKVVYNDMPGGVKRDLELMPCIGRGRYAAEHWIHSHPSIAACDLYKDPGYVWNYKGVPSHDFEKELRAAPRFDLAAYKIEGQCPHGDIWGLNLDDRLVEYQSLYGEQPSESWWGWKTYNTPFFIFTNANAAGNKGLLVYLMVLLVAGLIAARRLRVYCKVGGCGYALELSRSLFAA